jgi:hypothetical protein
VGPHWTKSHAVLTVQGTSRKALLGGPRIYIFRPAYVYPAKPRLEPNFSYSLLGAIYPAFRMLFPNQLIRADDLPRAMVNVAVRGEGSGEAWFSRTGNTSSGQVLYATR